MNSRYPTGLGEPELIGKQELFKPPNIRRRNIKVKGARRKPESEKVATEKQSAPNRVRITTALTQDALLVIQNIRQDYRLKTGNVLPIWKAISDVIEQSK